MSRAFFDATAKRVVELRQWLEGQTAPPAPSNAWPTTWVKRSVVDASAGDGWAYDIALRRPRTRCWRRHDVQHPGLLDTEGVTPTRRASMSEATRLGAVANSPAARKAPPRKDLGH